MTLFSTLLAQDGQFGKGITPVTPFYSEGSARSEVLAATNLELFISNALGALTVIAGLMFIFYFVLGALNWVTAAGEKGKVEKAREQMVQGVVGMVVIVISYALIGIVGTFVGLNLLKPGTLLLENLRPKSAIQQQTIPATPAKPSKL
jgi:hypothetical protein